MTSSCSCQLRLRNLPRLSTFPCGICISVHSAHRKMLQGDAEATSKAHPAANSRGSALTRGPGDHRALHSVLDFAPPCSKPYKYYRRAPVEQHGGWKELLKHRLERCKCHSLPPALASLCGAFLFT